MKAIYTSSDIRKLNFQRIIRVIFEDSPISKVDIAEKTNLTSVTVNTIVNQLIKKGVVVCEGMSGSSGGRKASLYVLKPNAFYFIGVNIGIDYLSILLSNFRTERIYTENIHLTKALSPENGVPLICDLITRLLHTHNISKSKLLGIGVTLPGLVDVEQGRIILLPNIPGWENIELKSILKKEFQTYVSIEKDSYGGLFYLKNRKKLTGLNTLFLAIKGGISMAILLDGKPYKGENGIAGEIGHFSLREDGDRCMCGNHGCFELYSSDYAVINKVRKEKGLSEKEREKIDLDYIIALYRENDAICRKVLLEASEYVGIMLSNAVKFYDPKLIVIYCKWIKEVDETLNIIQNTIAKRNALIHTNIQIDVIDQEDIYLEGAVALAFEHALESATENPLLRL